MPFGLDIGSSLFAISVLLFGSVLPLAVMIWAVITLARIRSAQTETLARLTAIEQRLGR